METAHRRGATRGLAPERPEQLSVGQLQVLEECMGMSAQACSKAPGEEAVPEGGWVGCGESLGQAKI